MSENFRGGIFLTHAVDTALTLIEVHVSNLTQAQIIHGFPSRMRTAYAFDVVGYIERVCV